MEALLTIERITRALDTRVSPLIDLSDLPTNYPAEKKRQAQLSRALAALAVMSLSEATPQQAADSITDGFNDLGLDAIYFERADDVLYVVQSKWHGGGQETIDQAECAKFLLGIEALFKADFSKGNERLRKRQNEINTVLHRSEVRIALVLAYTSSNKLGDHVTDLLNGFLARQNNVGDTEVVTKEVFDLRRIYANIDPSTGRRINLNVTLNEWGFVREPYFSLLRAGEVVGCCSMGRAW
jgi:hypothetical protein